jgi:integrase
VNTEAYSRPYTAAEVAAIRASCHELKTNAARHKALALVSLMSETGMRISDAAMLRRDAVSASDGTYWVTFEAIKNGAKVCLPLSAETVELLNTLPGSGTVHEQRGASGDSISLTGSYFFHSEASKPARTIFRMGRLLARVFKLSLVEGAHAHRFRKTIATRLAEQGEDIRLIARVLGDTPGVAERHYIFETPAYRERIRQAMKGT